MADGDDPKEGGASLDAAALRAKLGLGGSAPAPKPEPEPAPAPVEAAETAAAPPPGYDDEKTPVPSHLVDTVQDADVELEAPGGSRRIPMVPAVVTMVIVAVVGVLLGQVLGDSLQQREQKEAHQEIVARKLTMIRDSTTASGSTVIEQMTLLDEALGDAVRAIDEIETAGGDPLKLEKVFEDLLPKLIAYKRDGAFIDPEKLMDGITVIYADDLLLEATRFAVRTRHLFDTVSMTIDEAKALAQIGRPAGAPVQHLYAEPTTREIEGGKKIPGARGLWVLDRGKPDQVKLVDERKKKKTMQWQEMVQTMGSKKPIQVATDRVVDVDMKPIYAKHGLAVRLHTVNRLAALVRQARALSKKVAWKPLETKMSGWSAP